MIKSVDQILIAKPTVNALICGTARLARPTSKVEASSAVTIGAATRRARWKLFPTINTIVCHSPSGEKSAVTGMD